MNIALHKTAQKALAEVSNRATKWAIAALLLIGFMMPAATNAQVDCNIIMACNDLVQVSLGVNCTETIVPDMVMEDPPYDNSFFTVLVMDENGDPVANNIVNRNHVGMVLSASVTLNGCSISCWGNIRVEDKLPPIISNCVPFDTVLCEDNIDPLTGIVPRPTAQDLCSGLADLESFDETEVFSCELIIEQVTRTWIATDGSGNTSSCSQLISVTRATIDDVVMPRNLDDIDQDAIVCGTDFPTTGEENVPHPDYTGYPTGTDCANIQVFYDDIIFDLCGSSKKIYRQWTVLDWCTGRDTVDAQVIKVLDKERPIIASAVDTFRISTDPGKCTGSWDVEDLDLVIECSDYSYTVGYKLADSNGSPTGEVLFDNVVVNGPNDYTITDLPKGLTWIIYFLEDECGYTTTGFNEVLVIDNEAPTAICEGFSVVTLAQQGWADIFAESIDDNSEDNCEVVKYEIRRQTDLCGYPDDLNWGDRVNVCCADVDDDPNTFTKIELRVTDAEGKSNVCVANVQVEDKISPTVVAPPNITVNCTDPYLDIAFTGEGVGSDNCDVTVTGEISSNSLNDCNIGTIRRRWIARDNQGNVSAFRTQTITVVDPSPLSKSTINFPGDLDDFNGCSEADADPALTGQPEVLNPGCKNIAISYDDTPFEVNGACLKILRNWKVANWCDYDPQNPTYIEHVQKITLTNTERPIITAGCDNRVVESPEGDCEEFVEHEIQATDDCTPISLLRVSWAIDLYSDGTNDITGTGFSTSGVYPSGNHRMAFTVTDLCENTAQCVYSFRITDNKPPTPICLGEVVWVLDEDGNAEVWASDFNLKSEDSCDGDDLRYSFTADGNTPVMAFSCDDIDNGIAQEIPLQMWVIDSDGNREFCDVTLELQDSPLKNACEDMLGATGRIAGQIIDPNQLEAADINVTLHNSANNETRIEATVDEGKYMFDEVNLQLGYQVEPKKNDDVMNGVSTLDLVLIQRHILRLKELDSPYKLIAADINKSGSVTTADLTALRKVILGIKNQFEQNVSYNFVPVSYEFQDPTHPFDYLNKISYEMLMLDEMEGDFIAVKTGDVNNDAEYNARATSVEERSAPVDLGIFVNHQQSNRLEADFRAEFDEEVSGLQMTIEYNAAKLQLKDVASKIIDLDFTHIHQIREGLVTVSWNTISDKSISYGDKLFSLVFEGKDIAEGDIKITSEELKSELYNSEYSTATINSQLRTTAGITQNAVFTPNPFVDHTVLSFHSSIDEDVSLSIYDASGKQLYQTNINTVKGLNTLTLDKAALRSVSGVMVYKLESKSFNQTGRIVMIK